MSVLDIIKAVRKNSSKNEKVRILSENKENLLLKGVLERTYSPLIKYGIKYHTIPWVEGNGKNLNIEKLLPRLDMISDGKITGNSARSHLVEILSDADNDSREIILGIINSTQKMGCNVSSINKGMGRNTVKEAAYMGAVSYDMQKVEALFDKEGTLFSQHKLDGRFANMVINNGTVSCESRQGLPSDLGDIFDEASALEQYLGAGALNGEMLIRGYEKKREVGNGIVNALISMAEKDKAGEDIEKDVKKFMKEHTFHPNDFLKDIYYVVWDFVPLQNYSTMTPLETPYLERFVKLSDVIKSSKLKNISVVSSKIVHSPDEAKAHFLELLSDGLEGTIVKSMRAGWKKGKPSYQIKFKVELDFELKIVGGNFGGKGTKNEGKISSLNVETSCGLLTSSPGGFSEEDIAFYTENLDNLVEEGAIVTVKCYGISKGRNKDTYALSHPSIVALRSDKSEADSLELILERFEKTKNLEG